MLFASSYFEHSTKSIGLSNKKMFRENRWLLAGLGGMLLLPLAVTALAFWTLAATAPANLAVGVEMVATPTAVPDALSPEELAAAGAAAYEAGDLTQAETYLRAALAAGGTAAPADWRNTLGLVLADSGQLEEAAAVLATAVTLEPDLAAAQYNLGSVLADLGDAEAAETAYRAALAADPAFALAYNGLGLLYQERGEGDTAVTYYQQAIALAPDLAAAQRNLGMAYAGLERWEEAAAVLETAVSLAPDYVPTHYHLGVVYVKLGDVESAREHFEHVLNMDTGDGRWAARADEQLQMLSSP
ncbi:MAG TPA: tetratricopeptide repeat protein, partial [Anaerolineae bacterium]|nr:tetratricopeptide repeat protein [Anaerolineae bacterium]